MFILYAYFILLLFNNDSIVYLYISIFLLVRLIISFIKLYQLVRMLFFINDDEKIISLLSENNFILDEKRKNNFYFEIIEKIIENIIKLNDQFAYKWINLLSDKLINKIKNKNHIFSYLIKKIFLIDNQDKFSVEIKNKSIIKIIRNLSKQYENIISSHKYNKNDKKAFIKKIDREFMIYFVFLKTYYLLISRFKGKIKYEEVKNIFYDEFNNINLKLPLDDTQLNKRRRKITKKFHIYLNKKNNNQFENYKLVIIFNKKIRKYLQEAQKKVSFFRR